MSSKAIYAGIPRQSVYFFFFPTHLTPGFTLYVSIFSDPRNFSSEQLAVCVTLILHYEQPGICFLGVAPTNFGRLRDQTYLKS